MPRSEGSRRVVSATGQWWHQRRLTLDGLAPDARNLVIAAFLAWTSAALVLILIAFGVELPGGRDNIAAQGGKPKFVSRAVIVIAYAGLACASAAAFVAALDSPSRRRWAARAAIGIFGLGLAGSTFALARLVGAYNELGAGRDLFAGGATTVVRGIGVIAIVASASVILAPRAWLLRRRWLAGLTAAAPFVLGLVAYLFVRLAATGSLPPGIPAPHPQGLAAQRFVSLVQGAGFVVGALLLWQVVIGVRASRDIAVGIGRAGLRWRRLVLWLLAVKAGWLILGVLDVLPPVLGGSLDAWKSIRGEDWLSWLIVGGLAATVGWLLVTRPRGRRASEAHATVAAGVVAGGLVLFLLAATLALFAGHAFEASSRTAGLRTAANDAGGWFAGGLLTSQVVVVYVAGIAGIALVWQRRWRTAGIFLLLFFAWALPRALDITIYGEKVPKGAVGRVELASLDAGLTAALVIVALASLARRRRSDVTAALAVVLTASTAFVYTGQLFGSLSAAGAFYLGLMFPAAYRVVFDARSLNRRGRDRDARVLAFAGATTALLVIATVQIESRFLSANALTTGALGHLILAPALAAVLVVIVLASDTLEPPTQKPVAEQRRPARRDHAWPPR